MRSADTYNEKKIMQSIKLQSIEKIGTLCKLIELKGNDMSMNIIVELLKDTQNDIKNLRAY